MRDGIASRPSPRFDHPSGRPATSAATIAAVGIGLKAAHFVALLENRPRLDFVEVHAENFMVAGGPLHHYLGRVRAIYPLHLHGVGLSIGGVEPLDEAHLDRIAALMARYQPAVFSEHLAWSSHGGVYFNDLLPLAYDAATLARVCDHVDRVQARLGRTMLLENPSSYLTFSHSTMDEGTFLASVMERTGCGLLLDVNNVWVSACNQRRDAREALDRLPLRETGQIHLAGFARDTGDPAAPILIDDHGSPVDAAVWALFRHVIATIGPRPTLIERDHDVPPLADLVAEAERARAQMLAPAGVDV